MKFSKVEEAFLSGLMHDIGKVVLNIKLPEKMAEIIKEVYNNPEKTFIDLEQDALGFNHAQVGQLIAQKWNFAKRLTKLSVRITIHNLRLYCRHSPISFILPMPSAINWRSVQPGHPILISWLWIR